MLIIFFSTGAHCLKDLMKVQKDFENQYSPIPTNVETPKPSHMDTIQNYISKLQSEEVSELYPMNDNVPEKIDIGIKASEENKDSKDV